MHYNFAMFSYYYHYWQLHYTDDPSYIKQSVSRVESYKDDDVDPGSQSPEDLAELEEYTE